MAHEAVNDNTEVRIAVRTPQNWEESIQDYRNLLGQLLDGKDINSNEWWWELLTSKNFRELQIEGKERIKRILWHRKRRTHEQMIQWVFPDVINMKEDDFENQKKEKWFQNLTTKIFEESLKIMKCSSEEIKSKTSYFKSLLNGELSEEEITTLLEFESVWEIWKNQISFSVANKIAWGCIRKELLAAGIEIENDSIFWYLEWIIKRFSKEQDVEIEDSPVSKSSKTSK